VSEPAFSCNVLTLALKYTLFCWCYDAQSSSKVFLATSRPKVFEAESFESWDHALFAPGSTIGTDCQPRRGSIIVFSSRVAVNKWEEQFAPPFNRKLLKFSRCFCEGHCFVLQVLCSERTNASKSWWHLWVLCFVI